MRIGIVTRHVGRNDGQGRVNAEIAAEALRQGHAVTLFCEGADASVAADLRRMVPPGWVPGRLLRDQVFALRSWSALASGGRGGCDAILANGFATFAPADVNAVHFVHSSWARSSVHPWKLSRGARSAYARAYTGVNAGLERLAFRRARRVVAVSEKVRDELRAIGVPDERLSVILNGVDTVEFSPGPRDRARWNLPADGIVALFAGDLRTPRKNLDSVLKALARVPGVVLAVAGGDEGTPWAALAASLGVADRVRFLGFQRDMPALMRASDLFAFPSRYEACSLVLLEALASGLPVITARSAGGAEMVAPGTGVVLEDSEDIDGLAAALHGYAADPARLRAASAAARALAERHGWGAMARRYLALLEAAAVRTGRAEDALLHA